MVPAEQCGSRQTGHFGPGRGSDPALARAVGRIPAQVDRALEGFDLCSRLEGILPALETAHAVVEAMRLAAQRPKDDIVVICFSGRGDKDCFEVARLRGEEI